jgi:general stress protein YciG
VAKEDRGFASMDRAKQREIASKGGKAAHQKGTAHEWTSEEARDAGRKGGIASHQRRREQGVQGSDESDDRTIGMDRDRGASSLSGSESSESMRGWSHDAMTSNRSDRED